MCPRVSPRCVKFAINQRPYDFINEIDGLEIATCVDEDPVDCGPRNQHIKIREKLLFEIQQKSVIKFGQNDEISDS